MFSSNSLVAALLVAMVLNKLLILEGFSGEERGERREERGERREKRGEKRDVQWCGTFFIWCAQSEHFYASLRLLRSEHDSRTHPQPPWLRGVCGEWECSEENRNSMEKDRKKIEKRKRGERRVANRLLEHRPAGPPRGRGRGQGQGQQRPRVLGSIFLCGLLL
jgi:hypothetical protein